MNDNRLRQSGASACKGHRDYINLLAAGNRRRFRRLLSQIQPRATIALGADRVVESHARPREGPGISSNRDDDRPVPDSGGVSAPSLTWGFASVGLTRGRTWRGRAIRLTGVGFEKFPLDNFSAPGIVTATVLWRARPEGPARPSRRRPLRSGMMDGTWAVARRSRVW